MFDTVLVANRGEIAVRVIRTLRRLGVRSVAVFSDADADAPHVREADVAVRLGPADRSDSSAAETYLRTDQILAAARRTGAQAVHPGYGFLAENASFARACADAGLVFIGPPPAAVELMGDKINAKEAVRSAGVPVVPGSRATAPTDEDLVAAAADIGYPVLLKPSAGGGGKGMRLVRDPAELPTEIAAARRVARTAFGDDTLLLERWIDRPRHIEVQVLADAHGSTVHLGERECSLQRRHQKLIEEAPSVLLNAETRAAMGAAAVRAAESCGYTGAGTVEFIVPGIDPDSPTATEGVRDFFFMEMNTRLQVEHPVTELAVAVAGSGRLDLVEWQLRVAAGEPLAFAQSDISFQGHAIEARICAEDPERDFLPTGGRILLLDEPRGEGIRVDSGVAPGTVITSSYDPMLAKVIAYGPDRPTALRRLRAALADTRILGVTTNTGFLRRLLAHPEVTAGRLDTGLVEQTAQREPGLLASPYSPATAAATPATTPGTSATAPGTSDPLPTEEPTPAHLLYYAAALARHLDLTPAADPDGWTDPFSLPSGWRLGGAPAWTTHRLRVPGQDPVSVSVRPITASNVAEATDNPSGTAAEVEIRLGSGPVHRARADRSDDRLRLTVDGLRTGFALAEDRTAATVGPVTWLGVDGDAWPVHGHDPVGEGAADGAAHHGALTAPMPGTVTVVKTTAGESVRKGQPLLVLEAMKMEHVISAPHDGTVSELRATAGATVAMEELLVVVTPAEAASGPAADGPVPAVRS
ncbi:acetyl-CoA/propionyl-CoA carboxylase, biotin carboxylase, biotin carboxyl carrier protein [Streptomyces sp. TLI_053]|uniref:acetyl/propionyl/methylcrotonyl-CoA carboxylase subunit alpha n=1 Tax=Streptomyces sp. TLI_053 TaxID=1855352 RepID=UPI00087DBC5B|nr:biotin carboxylase N-terminal domain-containing protein [Streptomyces sp. TLI_053]SDT76279.1 acetyl-CoA/propionyl-CoA carboxylase, biotin carboxylase, biotin carboxyl carrier protein [Streptomyces sp. TLI_053]